MPPSPPARPERPRVGEVFAAFLRLGLTSFGGPVAHLGYFHAEFVARRRWLSEAAYADLVALGQFLPGPASSQVGFALGYLRAGLPGALAAWLGFTLPSALLMIAAAYGVAALTPGTGWLLGLKVAACAVVAQAVGQMARRLCPDLARILLALAAAALALLIPLAIGPVAVIALGLIVGAMAFPAANGVDPTAAEALPTPGPVLSTACLVAFFALLAGLPLLALTGQPALVLADAFYRAGALVFGGGHVVLPLLEAGTVGHGSVTPGTFLAGYGAAQALPGPLFSFAAYLGTLAGPGWLAGLGCLILLFLPAGLLVLGALPHWQRWRSLPRARGALAGANAAVVGLLLAALIHPVGTAALTSWPAVALTLAALAALTLGKCPPWAVVALCALAGGLGLLA